MPSLILVNGVLFCSLDCVIKHNPRALVRDSSRVTSIDHYSRINWEWTEEDGQGSRYGELCPVCEINYQDALDPKGVQERY